MKTTRARPRTIDEYLSGLTPDVQRVLARVRTTIRKALPRAEEAISYNIPAFKLNGRVVIYFAGWAEHYSIYPSSKRMEAAFRKELAPYEASGKGTIRFPLDRPVPARLIAAIARFRAKEVEERTVAKKR